MADDRNLIVHLYREALTQRISASLPGHASLLQAWLDALRARLAES